MLAASPDPAVVRATAERFTWEANAVALRDHLAGIAPRMPAEPATADAF